MTPPELTGEAKDQWDLLSKLVEMDVRAQIELHREDRTKTNRERVRNGLEIKCDL